ncbi:hypothetical protein ma869 [Moumouvirus australiensis]|uniref:Uncharacterized protein n=1 Tax=Moumouvirus australiensis TaxID=2109587 RepID=A0A2P1EMX0_9VIRU|nr:hypothetical protein QKC55_gp035 [Moumouvirus australiensis]AVL95256.1 hypothetical protein ma869 [Moumouvirus australiensis]
MPRNILCMYIHFCKAKMSKTYSKMYFGANHKTFNSYDKISLPYQFETLALIKKARKSFKKYTKINEKFIKDKYINDSTNSQIFLSKDEQFYCVNFNCIIVDRFIYFVGIIEKNIGKYFAIIYYHDMYHGAYLRLSSNQYDILDHELQFYDYKHIFENNPSNIIRKLKKRYNYLYEIIQNKINNNIDGKIGSFY